VSEAEEIIRKGENGAISVGAAGVSLESVWTAWTAGQSAETIWEEFPSLTLAEVYGAIAWALSHPDDVTAYMRHQNELWEDLRKRSEVENGALLARLRAARDAAAGRP
jgi:hypothetical protein